ncbi:FAD-dependent monooxygenase [Agromyces sp. Soil535]|uniref:FAD-dependent monooxygenase n=1 Tax=Agromyces sp. Soil535 TaxID=1736390 RepID=UPI000702097D|nr:FAD-dependent monooxygenase [Agromyces sp. Soil535]KRE31058.1 FAD-dependent oxidoreductase [Agromyces sp. Soil535]
MSSKKVLISGASIAGPAAALWLSRLGYDVTVVEQAPFLRPGGQAVDFKGRTHRLVLERMGIWDDVIAAQTPKTDLRIVDDTDRVRAVMPGEFIGGDVEILRGDLAGILHEHTVAECEYVFGDRITELSDTGRGVEVSFAHRGSETFDLVLGADGVHSAVRRLAFGPEPEFVKPLGYYYAVAGATVPSDLEMVLPSGRQIGYAYNEPGRLAILGGSKAPQLFVFAADRDDYDRHDVGSQKRFLERHYKDAGWRVPELLSAALASDEFYLDALARTRMTAFTSGRVALVGDAGHANTLGGFGTGLALVGAYILAGEVAAAAGDHRGAFAGYDRRMLKPTKIARSGNAGPFLAPPSRARIRMRDLNFSNRLAYAVMMKMTDMFATDDSVPDYPLPSGSRSSRY